jgi:hypothetical protein
LLLTSFGDGMCGLSPTLEVIMPSIRTTGISTIPAPTIITTASDTAQRLLSELQHADTIIMVMLGAMTVQQKIKVGAQLEAAGVAGEGMTRHHERRAVIEAANAVASAPPARPLNPTEQCWLNAFRAMDDYCRSQNLHAMKGMAKAFPRHVVPTLRLVTGGAS